MNDPASSLVSKPNIKGLISKAQAKAADLDRPAIKGEDVEAEIRRRQVEAEALAELARLEELHRVQEQAARERPRTARSIKLQKGEVHKASLRDPDGRLKAAFLAAEHEAAWNSGEIPRQWVDVKALRRET